ncbi:MAG: hypothetical protein WDO14_04190 [Bacteroidota bacterium]
MKRLVLFILIALSACQYEGIPTTSCNVTDPATDLPWLSEMIHELETSSLRPYFRVEQVEYNGEIGFYIRDCCPNCDTMPIFFKCSGDQVKNIDVSKLVPKGIIWQPADFACLMM